MKVIQQMKQLWNEEAPMIVYLAAAIVIGFYQH